LLQIGFSNEKYLVLGEDDVQFLGHLTAQFPKKCIGWMGQLMLSCPRLKQ
jgi:hypothetical protein